jgi:hypothetical protein
MRLRRKNPRCCPEMKKEMIDLEKKKRRKKMGG